MEGRNIFTKVQNRGRKKMWLQDGMILDAHKIGGYHIHNRILSKHATGSIYGGASLSHKIDRKKKVQAAVGFSAVLPVMAPRSVGMARVPAAVTRTPRGRVRAAVVTAEPAEVDYSSNISVFPMEACDLIGGEACNVQMYPEAKVAAAAESSSGAAASEDVEREYLAYDEPKTVFPGEACDDLGGEFCEAPYQTGVSRDASS